MIFSSAFLVVSYLLASATLMVLGRASGVFANVRGLRRGTIALVFGPIVIAWIYGWLLRFAPGHSYLFYLLLIIIILLPGGVIEGLRLARRLGEAGLISRLKSRKTGNIAGLLAIVYGGIALCGIAATALEMPLMANDPLEYFYVARHIFDAQQLIGVYPLIKPDVAGGFYGPWTHPPGFVLMIAWGFVIQGGAGVAGVAKLVDVYNFGALILLVFAWAGGLARYRGIVAALLVAISPILLGEAFDSHVDVPRIAMWTAAFCLLAYWFKQDSWKNTVALGVLVGLSMFVHSIGLLFWPLFIGLLVLVRGMSYTSRLVQAALLAFVSVLMVAPDYWQNIVHFGRLIGDSAPLWEIPRFRLAEFTNEQRGIATLRGKFGRGVLDQLSNFSLYGYTALAAAIAGICYGVSVLFASGFRPQRVLRHATSPSLLSVLLLSSIGFVGVIVLSIVLDMNLIIKNGRYLATMTGVYAILAITASDVLLRYFVWDLRSGADVPAGSPRWALQSVWRMLRSGWNAGVRWLREASAAGRLGQVLAGAVFLVMSIVLAISAADRVRYQADLRTSLFPRKGPSPETVDGQDVLACSLAGGFRIIGEINQRVLEGSVAGPIKVLAFRPSDVAYYAKFPFVSYLDPRLIPAYSAPDAKLAHDRLVELGLTHLLVPYYEMGEIKNTAFSSLISDPGLVETTIRADGYRLLRLAGQPRIFDNGSDAPLEVPAARPLEIDLSKTGQFIRGMGDRIPLECVGQLEHREEQGNAVLKVKGRALLQFSHLIEVDPNKAYRLSLDLRVTGRGGPAQTDIGLVTFDEDQNVQTDAPGAHRYGVAANQKIAADGAWNRLSGVFKGMGNQSFNQFRKGTRFVAPVLLLNYQGAGTTTEIRNLRLEQLGGEGD